MSPELADKICSEIDILNEKAVEELLLIHKVERDLQRELYKHIARKLTNNILSSVTKRLDQLIEE